MKADTFRAWHRKLSVSFSGLLGTICEHLGVSAPAVSDLWQRAASGHHDHVIHGMVAKEAGSSSLEECWAFWGFIFFFSPTLYSCAFSLPLAVSKVASLFCRKRRILKSVGECIAVTH